MIETCSLDFETRSAVNIFKTGAYRYAEDPTTEVMILSYAFDDGPVQRWHPGQALPRPLAAYIAQGGVLRAHNAQFERLIFNYLMGPRYGWPVPALEQWRCTAAEAAAMALPRSLAGVSQVLNVSHQKDDVGHKLMKKYSKPRKVLDDGTLVWWDDPEDLERLYLYCDRDVEAERAVAARLRRLSLDELATYQFDQRMNDRGVLVDRALVTASIKIVERGVEEANAELLTLTDGEVTGVTKVAQLTQWLRGQGLELDNLRKDTVRDLLDADGVEGIVERALELRRDAGRSSVAKLGTMLEVISPTDDRARGLQLYHGATTGRWSGKQIQPHNFPRGTLKYDKIIPYIRPILRGEYARIEADHPPLSLISTMLRSMLVAAPGQIFRSGDFSQIEARMVCWIAGDVYEDKEYERMAGVIYKRPWEEILAAYEDKDPIASEQRTMGKNTVLGAGFGMGPEKLAAQVKKQSGVDVPLELAKRSIEAYRERKFLVKQFWYDINDAAMEAVREPGTVVSVGLRDMLRFTVRGKFLWAVLPSGRPLAYALPAIKMAFIKREDGSSWQRLGIEYRGLDPKTTRWGKRRTYGGHLTENVVQAMARDVMRDSAMRVEAAGYAPVLLVHDEVLSEAAKDFGSQEEYLALMSEKPSWAYDCPITVEGWAGKRYRK